MVFKRRGSSDPGWQGEHSAFDLEHNPGETDGEPGAENSCEHSRFGSGFDKAIRSGDSQAEQARHGTVEPVVDTSTGCH
jgi:hypothetical protein